MGSMASLGPLGESQVSMASPQNKVKIKDIALITNEVEDSQVFDGSNPFGAKVKE